MAVAGSDGASPSRNRAGRLFRGGGRRYNQVGHLNGVQVAHLERHDGPRTAGRRGEEWGIVFPVIGADLTGRSHGSVLIRNNGPDRRS